MEGKEKVWQLERGGLKIGRIREERVPYFRSPYIVAQVCRHNIYNQHGKSWSLLLSISYHVVHATTLDFILNQIYKES